MGHDVITELAAQWSSAGMRAGSVVLLHSKIERWLRLYLRQHRDISPMIVLRSFLEVLGPEGTLVVPAFDFHSWTKAKRWDRQHSPSEMGALTEAARTWPSAYRSGHPIYSFVAIGRDAREVGALDNRSAYGLDSPFAWVAAQDGDVCVLDLPDQHSMTMYHYVEELCNVPYREHRTFSGEYIDLGVPSQRDYTLFVRRSGIETWVTPCEQLLWDARLWQGDRPQRGSGLRIMRAVKFVDFVTDIILHKNAHGLLYKFSDEGSHG